MDPIDFDSDRPQRSPERGYLWLMPRHGRGHYHARPRDNQWGRPSMILFLTELSQLWATAGLGGVHNLGIGDISLKNGKAPPRHFSHTEGSCVDLYILARGGRRRAPGAAGWITVEDAAYDRQAMDLLVRLIVQVLRGRYQVVQFLFNDTALHRHWPGRIRSDADLGKKPKDWRHSDHIHIQLNDPNPYQGFEEGILAQGMNERRQGAEAMAQRFGG